jgi:hypothetical protein
VADRLKDIYQKVNVVLLVAVVVWVQSVREYAEEQAWERFLIPAQLSAMVLVSLNVEVHDNNGIERFCT